MHLPSLSLTIFPLMVAMLGVDGLSAFAQVPNPDAYRKYALTHQGDAARGMELFNDPQLLCANCHSVDGSAGKAGPDLAAAGDAFGRQDLVDSILHPSATISPGYGTLFVETKTGAVFQGTLKQKTETELKHFRAPRVLASRCMKAP